MARKLSATSLCLILACLPVSTVADARGRSPIEPSSFVPIREASPTLAPFQHVRFCLHYPADCKSDPTEAAVVELSSESNELINRVNHRVNAAILPVRKSGGTDLQEGWT